MNETAVVLFPGWGMEPPVWSVFGQKLRERWTVWDMEWRKVTTACAYKRQSIDFVRRIRSSHSTLVLIGWSLGALVLLDVIASTEMAADRIVLFGATPCFIEDPNTDDGGGWSPAFVRRMQRQLQRDKTQTLTSFYQWMFSPKERTERWDESFIRYVDTAFVGTDRMALQAGLHYLLKTDLRDQLTQIQTPTLLIHGTQDPVCSLQGARYISDHLPSVQWRPVPHAGHVPFWTHLHPCWEWTRYFVEKGILHD